MTPALIITDGQIGFAAWTIQVVLIVLALATALRHRRHATETDLHLCRGCASPHVAAARFCRRCGRPV